MKATSVIVYFPAEFGVDHHLHDFSFGEWNRKKENLAYADTVLPGVKICQVFAGLVLEKTLGPWLGLSSTSGRYIAVGSKDVALTCTSLANIGRTVAQLAILGPQRIPSQVHVSGSTRTIVQIARIMGHESGRQIPVVEVPLQEYKASVLLANRPDIHAFLRFVIGEGKANHGRGGLWNQNELVNPGESLWKWKTIEQFAKETGGRPFTNSG